MIGIYKITSPSGKVYIGQSWNIKHRWKEHIRSKKNLPITNSLRKYGASNHIFQVCTELPFDIKQETLDQLEQVYCDFYKDAGFKLLNLREGKKGGKLSVETKLKLSLFWKGRKTGRKMPDDLKKIHSDRMKIKNIGNKYGTGNKNRIGAKHSDDTKNKISKSHCKNIWVIYKDNILIGRFNSCNDASKYLNIPPSSIRCLKNRPIKSKGKKYNGFKITLEC